MAKVYRLASAMQMALTQGDLCRNVKNARGEAGVSELVEFGEAAESVLEFALFFFAGL